MVPADARQLADDEGERRPGLGHGPEGPAGVGLPVLREPGRHRTGDHRPRQGAPRRPGVHGAGRQPEQVGELGPGGAAPVAPSRRRSARPGGRPRGPHGGAEGRGVRRAAATRVGAVDQQQRQQRVEGADAARTRRRSGRRRPRCAASASQRASIASASSSPAGARSSSPVDAAPARARSTPPGRENPTEPTAKSGLCSGAPPARPLDRADQRALALEPGLGVRPPGTQSSHRGLSSHPDSHGWQSSTSPPGGAPSRAAAGSAGRARHGRARPRRASNPSRVSAAAACPYIGGCVMVEAAVRPQSAACGLGPVAVAQVGHEAVGVLIARSALRELDDGPLVAEVRPDDRVEAAVPQPLPGVGRRVRDAEPPPAASSRQAASRMREPRRPARRAWVACRRAAPSPVVSFRLGRHDGVSVVAATWARALDEPRVDGAHGRRRRCRSTACCPASRIGATGAADAAPTWTPRSPDADLVVVENLCTIPLNLPAARVVAAVPARAAGGAAPPRSAVAAGRAGPTSPSCLPDDPAWRHVTINRLTERQMAERGIAATTIYNGFDVDEPPRRPRRDPRCRSASRRTSGSSLHPVRAIERKDVPGRARAGRGDRRHLLARRARPRTATSDELAAPARRRAACRVIHRPSPGHDGRRLRRLRRGGVPVDVGGVRQPADRGRHPPAAGGGRPLPGRRRAAGPRASGGSTPTDRPTLADVPRAPRRRRCTTTTRALVRAPLRARPARATTCAALLDAAGWARG